MDLISRQAVLALPRNVVRSFFGEAVKETVDVRLIETLPTIEPRAKGWWIRHENADIVHGFYVPMYECSKCHAWKRDNSGFCPDCGADMRGEKDG